MEAIKASSGGKILEVLKNWPERSIQVIVVTDGERILGLGDLGCQGMGIPVGKLALYTALGGVRPSSCLPITIDVGTNNEQLLNDEFYIGLRQKRATGQEYYELLHEFMTAVKQNYGEKVLIQFEDFANHNAFELLAKYGTAHLVFNDDIQGTASVVLARVVAALKLIGGTLADHTFLFLGAGEAIKPAVLIGSSKVGKTFTKEVVEAMTSNNEKPLIMALSNPTSQSECTAEEAYQWSEGCAIFASGSPFDPVEHKGKVYFSGQANNAYIFPGFGLGLVISGAIRVHDDMLLAAFEKEIMNILLMNYTAEALAKQVTEENYKKGFDLPTIL
ncbi:hypothetical protein SESBI_13255 [Sesbania bispinosa]|nr:hypothetical protein SESBI_13255 [Sesbania bispinosa]